MLNIVFVLIYLPKYVAGISKESWKYDITFCWKVMYIFLEINVILIREDLYLPQR